MALRLLASAVILGLLFALLPFHALVDALRRMPSWAWVVAVGAYLGLHLIGVAKWRMLIGASGARLSSAEAVRCYYTGLFANTFLPSLVGGDIVRAGLAIRLSGSTSGVLLGSLVDRMQDVIGLAALAGIGMLLLPSALDEQSRGVFLALGLGLAAFVALVSALVVLLPPRRIPMRIRRRMVRPRRAFRALAGRPGHLAAAFLLGMLLQTLQVVLNAWLGLLIGIHVSAVVWLFVWPLAKIASLLPVTQGGLGVREAANVALFAPFGVPGVAALAVSLVFQAIIISGGLVGGALALVVGRGTS
jgi:uncharacterized membrane protein YbhN (UPF0104 family)